MIFFFKLPVKAAAVLITYSRHNICDGQIRLEQQCHGFLELLSLHQFLECVPEILFGHPAQDVKEHKPHGQRVDLFLTKTPLFRWADAFLFQTIHMIQRTASSSKIQSVKQRAGDIFFRILNACLHIASHGKVARNGRG